MEGQAMSAVDAVRAAHAAGIKMTVDGECLLLEANAEPPGHVLDDLSRHKQSILALLRPRQDGWTALDWQAFFDERAGVAEFDGGSPRTEAEEQAFKQCVIEWLNRNPAPSVPACCVICGKSESGYQVVLPFGTEPGTHAWLHGECWPAWHKSRLAEAIVALGAMGIRSGNV
jgi:hypothetical protein